MTDQSLIQQLKENKPEAFRLLVDTYQALVINTCYSFTMNREDAEDIAQEVFIEVYRSVDNFKGDSKLSTWLYRISINKSIDHLRKIKRKKRIQFITSFFDHEDKQIIDPASNTLNPEENLEQEERVIVLHRAIEQLPEQQKIAFTLNKFDDLPAKEIAIIMDTSLSSIEALIHRAKQNLRKLLKDYYEKNMK